MSRNRRWSACRAGSPRTAKPMTRGRGSVRRRRSCRRFWCSAGSRTPPTSGVLARDAKVSIATAYRYVHEAIDVIALRAPGLPDVLARGLAEGWDFVCLAGTLVPTVRCATKSEAGHDLWYSGEQPPTRRQRASADRPGRLSGMGQSRRAGLHPRHHRRPRPTRCPRCTRPPRPP